MTKIQVRQLTRFDAHNCTEIHMQAFEGFFLTFLGADFLRELYSAIACDPSCIGFVAEAQGSLLGFVIGTSHPSRLYTRLLRSRWWNFGIASLGALARRPSIIPRLLRAFTMPNQKTSLPVCGTLMSIAVNPDSQGCGVGKMLVKAFLEEAIRRDLRHVNLTTDRINNDCTNQFYQRLGFSLLSNYTTPEGRQMNEYVIRLCPEGQPVPMAQMHQIENRQVVDR